MALETVREIEPEGISCTIVGSQPLTARRSRMVGTVTEALRHIQADLALLLDAPTMLALCREVGYHWRTRLLDPVTTVPLFLLQILHGNTACSHLPHLVAQRFTASAYCQARTRLPLVVWPQWL